MLSEQAPLRDLIVRNVEHADAIIESFLSYMRTDAEGVEDMVDLGAVAASAARLAGLPAAQVRIASGASVRGNATMLQRLLANLLDNAARHGAPPILLSLKVDRGARQAELTVEDHGQASSIRSACSNRSSAATQAGARRRGPRSGDRRAHR